MTPLPIKMTLPRGFAGVSGVTGRLMSDGAGVTPAARARNRSAAQGRSGRQVLLDNLGAGEPRDFVGMPAHEAILRLVLAQGG
jgi:hypothetical protein